MDKRWVILIIVVIILSQQIKKEGKWQFQCSSDRKSIQLLNRNTGAYVDYIKCEKGEECLMEDEQPVCRGKEEMKAGITTWLPLIGIAGALFLIFLTKGGKLKWRT